MLKEKFTTLSIARAGIIAGLYVAVSFVIAPLASGAIQIRISEALCMLALILPESIPALFIGCMLSNLITGCAVYDVVFGSLITLISATLSFFCAKTIKNTLLKIFVGGLFPVMLNALFLPLVWQWCYGYTDYVYALQVLFLVIGQAVSVYGLGTPLFVVIEKLKNKGAKFLQ